MQILIGDVFRCKRRGHEIIVSAIVSNHLRLDAVIYYRNIRGAMVRIKASRLLNKSRFEPMLVEALKVQYSTLYGLMTPPATV